MLGNYLEKLFWLGSLVFLPFLVLANSTDSLQQLLKQDTVSYTHRIKIHQQLGKNYTLKDSLKSQYHIQKAIALAEEHGDTILIFEAHLRQALWLINLGRFYEGESKLLALKTSPAVQKNSRSAVFLYQELGSYYEQVKKIALAREYGFRALQLLLEAKDTLIDLYAVQLRNIGNIYQFENQYDSALFYNTKALATLKAINNRSLKPSVYTNLGIVYYYLDSLGESVFYFQKAIDSYKATGQSARVGQALFNMAVLLHHQGLYNQSIDYYLQVLNIYEKTKPKRKLLLCYTNLAINYFKIKFYDRARRYLFKALPLAEALPDTFMTGYIHKEIALTFLQKNDLDSAEYHIQKSLNLLAKIKLTKAQEYREAQAVLASLYEKRPGRIAEALTLYQQIYTEAQAAKPAQTEATITYFCSLSQLKIKQKQHVALDTLLGYLQKSQQLGLKPLTPTALPNANSLLSRTRKRRKSPSIHR